MGGVKAALWVATVGALLGGSAAAFGAGMPAGGSVRFYATPSSSGGGTTIMFTGAIGDYGKTVKIDKNGKPDTKGAYTKFMLQKGTFVIAGGKLNALLNKANPKLNKTTCSAVISVTAPGSAPVDGTGLYKGISGSLKPTATFAFILPRFTSGKNKGQCNGSNNSKLLDQYSSITGSGTVKFS